MWELPIGVEVGGLALRYSVRTWINNGLMAIFFLLVGLEIERELTVGKLSNLKSATLPIFAAVGGMATPMLLHFLLNRGTATQRGVGIPMSTDIAFALGALALLGRKVPASLKVFLTALAIVDDLGAIAVIALFYARDVALVYLLLALGVWVGLLVCRRLGVRRLVCYLVPGALMWYLMLQSGVSATLTGVLLAFALPFGRDEATAPSRVVREALDKPVRFGVMPLFALANTAIALGNDWTAGLFSANTAGIFAGLYLGKPLGITLWSLAAVKLDLSQWPGDLPWKHLVGAGFLGGIGFTMPIFITLLAFDDPGIVQSAKVAILCSALAAGTTGVLLLSRTSARH